MKTRFAPSPTGEMHFGNVRTALFNVLAAIGNHGTFLLRIEDTDEVRSSQDHEELLYQDLAWLGLEWQEGSTAGGQSRGDKGPYRQSERQEIYNHYYDVLVANNHAYHCFCTEEQLAYSRKMLRSQGLPPRYSGKCAHLSQQEIADKKAKGMQPTLRLKIDKEEDIKFLDVVKGEQIFKANDIGDFIIRRANGTASFMFCNAVDDALMGVTLVLRGDDHLTNTPRQIMIMNKLGFTPPQYGHINTILGNDGKPLSKRHGSRSLKALREEGFLPNAIVNCLARLGHKYDNMPYSSLSDLGENFKITNLSASPATYNEQHLLHWQKEAVLSLSPEQFSEWVGKDLMAACPDAKRQAFLQLMQQNILFPIDVKTWLEKLFSTRINYNSEQMTCLRAAGAEYFELALDYVNSQKNVDIKTLTNLLKDKLNIKGKELFMPLRICLTMEEHGPELQRLVDLMDTDDLNRVGIKARFRAALRLFKSESVSQDMGDCEEDILPIQQPKA